MDSRRAEARKVEAMEQTATRLDRIEAKLDRLLELHEQADGTAAEITKAAPIGKPAPSFTQPPAKGR
jgi:hypothetical protein